MIRSPAYLEMNTDDLKHTIEAIKNMIRVRPSLTHYEDDIRLLDEIDFNDQETAIATMEPIIDRLIETVTMDSRMLLVNLQSDFSIHEEDISQISLSP